MIIQTILLFLAATNADKYLKLDLEFEGMNYVTNLEVGSEKELVTLQIDTGSSDTWVKTSQSTNNTNNDKYFHINNSETFHSNDTNFEMVYGSGYGEYVNGTWGTDNFFVNGTLLGNMTFAVVGDTSQHFGLLGLGLPECESTYYHVNDGSQYMYNNFPMKLVENGIIDRNLYSIYLDQDYGHGELLFGAIDNNKFDGEIYKFPLVNGNSLVGIKNISAITITLNEISILNLEDDEKIPVAEGYMSALLDTGVTNAMLPKSILEKIANELDLDYDSEANIYTAECSKLDNKLFEFNFQGVNFSVPILNFAYMHDNQKLCGLPITETYMQQFIALGQSFLDSIYMVVDLDSESVALANAVFPSNESDIIVLENGIEDIENLKTPPDSITYDLQHMIYSTLNETIKTNFDQHSTYHKKSLINSKSVAPSTSLISLSTSSSYSLIESIAKVSNNAGNTSNSRCFTWIWMILSLL